MAEDTMQTNARIVTPDQLRTAAAVAESKGRRINALGDGNNRFAVEEQERRNQSPILIHGRDIAKELASHDDMVYLVDPRLGFNNKTNRLWINHVPAGGEEGAGWKTVGHRHTVEAVIYWLSGHGYSIIDGIRYDWKAGDFICVPMFAWHRHVNESEERATKIASTTGPLSMGLGQAIYEDERYPEYWIYAKQGEEAMKSLVPGGGDLFPNGVGGDGALAALYRQELNFASQEESRRRASRVMVRTDDLIFEDTPMGRMAYIVDARIGFHVKALSTVMGEVPPGEHSGAHRHLYDEIDYVVEGTGRCTIDDMTFDIEPGDTLAIPAYSWHQYECSGVEPLRVLAFSTRQALENLGLSHTQQGELAG